MTANPDRARDERDLSAIRLRNARIPFDVIAERLGLTRQRVNRITGDIKRADLDESGEPRGQVVAGYWGQ
ncbi:MAG: hypothetical protein L0G27_05480 [Paracoccus sp. (in: a-proteobacteria)]|nr:hypothetical protein [Paracoccus sp. (in: a-proteobacteria)]